ncbi:MAG TPA: hypothetical protein VF903_05855 [Nitrospirota bacterium]
MKMKMTITFLEGTALDLIKKKALPALAVLALVTSCSGGGGSMGSDPLAGAMLVSFGTISTVASTVPANGDVNPYGVAVVKSSVGNLTKGDILVSNFNNSANLQGTGTTIVEVAPNGTSTLFSKIDAASLPGACPGGVGLTTALVALRSGWVIVGSLPTKDGMAATAQAGCLIVLDSTGKPVETFSGPPINGPWDMTAWERNGKAKLFVTNVLNGTVAGGGSVVNKGTVVRIDLDLTGAMPAATAMTVIGSGFSERTDPAALVIGPTGVGLGHKAIPGPGENLMAAPDDEEAIETEPETEFGMTVLYVADSLNNAVQIISEPLDRMTPAGIGTTLTSGGSLNDPLGLIVARNRIFTVNGNDGFLTEITPAGKQIATRLLDNTGTPPGAGTLFGLAFVPGRGIYFVDDGTNTLNLIR